MRRRSEWRLQGSFGPWGGAPKKLAGGPVPDLEEAYKVDDNGKDVSEDEKKDVDNISSDKLIQAANAGNTKGKVKK